MSNKNRSSSNRKQRKKRIVKRETVTVTNRPPRRVRRSGDGRSHGKPHANLSHCASDYARCLANPFSGPLACIPDYPPIRTRRVRTFARGTALSSTTSGVGYVIVTPQYGATSDGIAGFYSQATYAGTVVATNTATAGVSTISTNADYTNAVIGGGPTQIQYRTVAAGLRVRFAGTEYNRGGTIYGLQEPTHDSLDAANILDFQAQEDGEDFDLLNLGGESIRKKKRTRSGVYARPDGWIYNLYRPVTTGETNFSTVPPSTSTNQSAATAPRANYMGFIWQSPGSPSTNQMNMNWEFYTVQEYSGRPVRGATPSHHDPTGFAAVQAAAENGKTLRRPTALNGPAIEESFLDEVGDFLMKGVSWVGGHLPEIASAGAAMLSML